MRDNCLESFKPSAKTGSSTPRQLVDMTNPDHCAYLKMRQQADSTRADGSLCFDDVFSHCHTGALGGHQSSTEKKDRIDIKREQQQKAIFDGIRSGDISFEESQTLLKEQSKIERKEQRYERDGISRQERHSLNSLLEKAKNHIIEAGGKFSVDDQGHDTTAGANRRPPDGSNIQPTGHSARPSDGGHQPSSNSHQAADSTPHPANPSSHPVDTHTKPADSNNENPVQQLLHLIDQNGDGQISLAELLQTFQSMDNHDGLIAGEELKAFLHQQTPSNSAPSSDASPTASHPHSGDGDSLVPHPNSPADTTTPRQPVDAPLSPTTPAGTASGTLAQVLAQNDRTQATTYAEGDSNANSLNASRSDTIPAGAKGISGWGLVTNEDGAQVDRSATVQIQNMQTYVHLKTGGWKLVENQNDSSNGSKIAGMTENTNFTNVVQVDVENNNGIASLAAPPGPYTMDHFGVANSTYTPGVFDENSIDGVFVRADAKASTNNSGLIAKLGGEWWSNPKGSDNTIIGVPGTNNFTKLTDQWQSMYFSSVDKTTLENDPPPGIGNDTKNTQAINTTPQAGSSTGDNYNSNTKLILPFPTDAQWPEILQKAPAGSLTFSIYSGNNETPDSFNQIGQNVESNLDKARAKGLVPLGYVGTGAGSLPIEEAKRRIDLWMDAGAAGIYLGGSGKPDGTGYATDPASEAYYDQLADYIHAKGGKAFINGVYMNGGSTNPHYYGKMDGQGNHEGFMDDFEKQMVTIAADPHPESEFVFVSGVQSADLARVEKRLTDAKVGYIWITDVNYGASPEYLDQEIANLG